ncbi:hypothetical protein V8E36_001201 [Tilletia maclaganii]
MKLISAAAVLALSASLVAAEPVLHPTPAPVKRQVVPTDFGQINSFANVESLSSYYAQATSALSQAASAGAPSSLVSEQRSSLDAVFSSAFAALSASSDKPSGSSRPPSSSTSSSGGSGAGVVGVSLDLSLSLALTGAAGLLAAVMAL